MRIVRENTEGEYSSVGGKMYQNTGREIVIQGYYVKAWDRQSTKFAFELAKNVKEKLTTTKSKAYINNYALLG